MQEGTRATAVLEPRLDEGLAELVLAVALEALPEERIQAGLEAVVEYAEFDPEEAREVLWALRGDHLTLARLEVSMRAVSPERATLALGAALQIASAELASPEPNLRSRVPELMRWLKGGGL